jgi:hypothetical protein
MYSAKFPVFRRKRPVPQVVQLEPGRDNPPREDARLKTIALWIVLMARP